MKAIQWFTQAIRITATEWSGGVALVIIAF